MRYRGMVLALPAAAVLFGCNAFELDTKFLGRRARALAVRSVLQLASTAETRQPATPAPIPPVLVVRAADSSREVSAAKVRPAKAKRPKRTPAAAPVATAHSFAHSETAATSKCSEGSRTFVLTSASFAPEPEVEITPDLRLQLPRAGGGISLCPRLQSSVCGQAAPAR